MNLQIFNSFHIKKNKLNLSHKLIGTITSIKCFTSLNRSFCYLMNNINSKSYTAYRTKSKKKKAHNNGIYFSHRQFYNSTTKNSYGRSKTSLLKQAPLYCYHNRFMFKYVRNAIFNPNNTAMTKRFACTHSGVLKPKAPLPKVNTTDVSGQHQIVVYTDCQQKDCKDQNCSDATDTNLKCPQRTVHQNQQDIPPTTQGFKTTIVGNTTSELPGKTTAGVLLNATRNYKGAPKPQWMVTEEPAPAQINSDDINVNPQSTNFVQEKEHFNNITKTL